MSVNWRWVIRIATVVALIGFFLSWAFATFSGVRGESFSGLDLAFGDDEKVYGEIFIPALLALLAVVGSAVASFLVKADRKAGLISCAAASAALLLVAASPFLLKGWVGDLATEQIAGQARQADAYMPGMGAMFGQVTEAVERMDVKIKLKTGYWLTLLGVIGAVAGAYVGFTGRPVPGISTGPSKLQDIGARMASAASAVTSAVGESTSSKQGASDDSYWDGIADKHNPDALEEYLARFPQGKFSDLARRRLERSGAS